MERKTGCTECLIIWCGLWKDWRKLKIFDLSSRLWNLRITSLLRFLDVLDKVLNMALECNLSADKMIKKIFFFIYTGDPFFGCWKTDSEPIRKKFEMNGYVMPNIVCWDLEFRLIPIVISTGDMKTLFGFNYWSWLVCVYTVYSYSSTAPDWCLLFLWNTVTLEIITLPPLNLKPQISDESNRYLS